MTMRRRRGIAWIALAAMLFSAVSPALAAALFPERPDILGRMLAIPAPAAHAAQQEAAAAEDDGCPHESAGMAGHEQPSHSAHHGNSGHQSHDDSEHAAHGTFCSFCLSASATVTLLAPPAGAWAAPITTAVLLPVEDGQRPAAFRSSTRHPRDPPVILS